MQCVYWRPINSKGEPDDKSNNFGAFYFNGVNCRYINHPDSISVIKEIYRKNNGREMPDYNETVWNKNAPWYKRLEAVAPVVK